MKPTTPPPIDEDEAVRLYGEGHSIAAVAEKLDVRNPNRVRVILHRRDDVVVRKPGSNPRVNRDRAAAGTALRQALDRLGITQAEAARRMGISAKHLNQMALGATPIRADFAVHLHLTLGIDGRALLHLQADDQFDKAHRLLAEDDE